ncbi:hypothetical protein [Prevotella sp.]|uniref:hypothetical protein n=1 Tax=Prevotella sp. TaxID=59823 RepID=UPI0025F13AEF|nr:hypothetical protein [Prevotella sp.]
MDIEYKAKGYCSFRLGDFLNRQTENIPAGYGVYLFRKNTEDGDILYIGKSGTMLQNGSYKAQYLRKRLNNKQDGIKREDFLSEKIKENTEIWQIIIEWYIIDERKHLPGLIEAILLQGYYTQHSCLPIWNNEF